MLYFVYILESFVDGSLYKGYTSDYMHRLSEHNEGQGHYSSQKKSWRLIYVEECDSKCSAIIREKQLKKYNRRYIEWLCCQGSNKLRNQNG